MLVLVALICGSIADRCIFEDPNNSGHKLDLHILSNEKLDHEGQYNENYQYTPCRNNLSCHKSHGHGNVNGMFSYLSPSKNEADCVIVSKWKNGTVEPTLYISNTITESHDIYWNFQYKYTEHNRGVTTHYKTNITYHCNPNIRYYNVTAAGSINDGNMTYNDLLYWMHIDTSLGCIDSNNSKPFIIKLSHNEIFSICLVSVLILLFIFMFCCKNQLKRIAYYALFGMINDLFIIPILSIIILTLSIILKHSYCGDHCDDNWATTWSFICSVLLIYEFGMLTIELFIVLYQLLFGQLGIFESFITGITLGGQRFTKCFIKTIFIIRLFELIMAIIIISTYKPIDSVKNEIVIKMEFLWYTWITFGAFVFIFILSKTILICLVKNVRINKDIHVIWVKFNYVSYDVSHSHSTLLN